MTKKLLVIRGKKILSPLYRQGRGEEYAENIFYKETGYAGVRVNCITPGAIDTKMNECFTKEELAALCEEIPAGRLGRAEEAARAIVALWKTSISTGRSWA